MLFKQAARGDERLFVSVKNVEATSITTGQAAALRIGTAASFDGQSVVRTSSANAGDLPGWIGIASQDISSNGFGLVQVYGNCASILLSVGTTSVTINVGDPLIPGVLAGGLASAVPTYAASGFRYVLASNVPVTTSLGGVTNYVSGWIRTL